VRYRFRPILVTDEPFLWEMLYHAAHVDEEAGGSVEKMKNNPFLTKYVVHWGRPGDLGFVAEDAETHQRIGAAWLRTFVGAEKNCSDIEDGVPELAVAMIPSRTGQGIGVQLLGHLLDAAAPTYPAVYLSVRATNPAKRLYERFGFVVIGELTNRVGGKSFHMKKNFPRTPEAPMHATVKTGEDTMKSYAAINFRDKLAKFTEHWSPKVIAEMNDYQFKLVKFEGEFVWHDHKHTDEVFIVISGEMDIEFRDGAARVGAGEMFVVPRGAEHRTRAALECHALIVEPRGVVNTGDAGGELTAANDVWI
jgi:mannose-6-phosphate isomerase-like protein (cupin superfamily)/ribosomal protein S18 acetylase RimI-like enzyme